MAREKINFDFDKFFAQVRKLDPAAHADIVKKVLSNKKIESESDRWVAIAFNAICAAANAGATVGNFKAQLLLMLDGEVAAHKEAKKEAKRAAKAAV